MSSHDLADAGSSTIQPRVRGGVSLAGLTTLRLGGPARRLVETVTAEEAIEAVAGADAAGEPSLVLGGGSNLVIADEGFPGTVVPDSHPGRVARRGRPADRGRGRVVGWARHPRRERGPGGNRGAVGDPRQHRGDADPERRRLRSAGLGHDRRRARLRPPGRRGRGARRDPVRFQLPLECLSPLRSPRSARGHLRAGALRARVPDPLPGAGAHARSEDRRPPAAWPRCATPCWRCAAARGW